MKGLLADLESTSGKKPWREYTIRHGIETFEVLIPFENTLTFESEIHNRKLTNRQAVIQFVMAHGGEFKD